MTSDPVAELHPLYSSPGAAATPWQEVVAVLEHAEIFWISTVRADGRPHVAPLPAMWLNNALHFGTGLDEQKGRNVLRNPNWRRDGGAVHARRLPHSAEAGLRAPCSARLSSRSYLSERSDMECSSSSGGARGRICAMRWLAPRQSRALA